MTIGKTLLRAFFLIGLTPATILAILSFITARAALQDEIEQGLVAQATTVAADINQTLFERIQNASTWNTLEVMQDLQVQDIDKRLSNFLAKLKLGYGGVYRQLDVVDRRGMVVSSSNPAALGRTHPVQTIWQSVAMAGARVTIELPRRAGNEASLDIRAPIVSQFSGEPLGELILEFDWNQIEAFLDSTAAGGRTLALVDPQGQVLAASQALREAGLLSGAALADWRIQALPAGAFRHDGAPVGDSDVIVGLGRAGGFAGFAGIGLTTLVIDRQSEALAPVRRMAAFSLALLAVLILITRWVAGRVSGAIARPIVALTDFTRGYRPGQAVAEPPPAAAGEVGELGEAFAKMMRDIDESRQKLVQASKLAVVGEMSAVLAHEVRTPLGILRSSAQMLRREPGLSAEARELMGFIESETERLNRLVSAMLDSARPRPLHKVASDMHGLVRQCRGLLGAQLDKRRITVTERLDAADPTVDCDAEQITQVLLNLMLNALQILPEGGQIRVTTYQRAEQFFIEIADDGPGVPVAERSRIFEAFFFRREGGVGLGLAIVQQIIVAHDGDISVGESALGGARFTIRLPQQTNDQPGSQK